MHLNAYTLGDDRRLIDGKWVPARPLQQPWAMRLRNAWDVLWGRAESVVFPGQEASDGNP